MKETDNTTDITIAYVFIKNGQNITQRLAEKVTIMLKTINPEVKDVLVECDSANNTLSTFLAKLKKHMDDYQRVAIFYVKFMEEDQIGLFPVSDGNFIMTIGLLNICEDTFNNLGDAMSTDEIIAACAEAMTEETV